jgi:hypothetical protein
MLALGAKGRASPEIVTIMKGSIMSRKNSARRNLVEEEHLPNSGVALKAPVELTLVSRPSSRDEDGPPVPPWQPIFVLCEIGFGLLVLAAKAIGQFLLDCFSPFVAGAVSQTVDGKLPGRCTL